MLFPAAAVNDPKSEIAIANGQYIVVKRSVYNAVGGAERVKDQIAEDLDEDLEFGKAVKGDGYRLYIADGRHLMRVRMYTNLAELWEGWGKNTVLSMQRNPAMGVISFLGILHLTVGHLLLARWAVRSWKKAQKSGEKGDKGRDAWITGIAVWQIILPFFFRRQVDRALGLHIGWTLTQPFGVAVFGILMLNSVRRLLTGQGVTWKGRTYAGRG